MIVVCIVKSHSIEILVLEYKSVCLVSFQGPHELDLWHKFKGYHLEIYEIIVFFYKGQKRKTNKLDGIEEIHTYNWKM